MTIHERYKWTSTVILAFNNVSFTTLYFPTDAHNVKNVELLKHFKIGILPQHISVYNETIMRESQSVLS